MRTPERHLMKNIMFIISNHLCLIIATIVCNHHKIAAGTLKLKGNDDNDPGVGAEMSLLA
jgi:hypothetical protein